MWFDDGYDSNSESEHEEDRFNREVEEIRRFEEAGQEECQQQIRDRAAREAAAPVLNRFRAPTSKTSILVHDGSTNAVSPILTIYNRFPVYLEEDWHSGIGGGLWSTGLAMAQYFCSWHFQTQLKRIQRTNNRNAPIRILELGSGNGFLSVCLVVAAMMRPTSVFWESGGDLPSRSNTAIDPIPVQVVATDTAEHLPLMQNTINVNLKSLSSACPSGDDNTLDLRRFATVQEYLWGDTIHTCSKLTSPEAFDLIIGSDLAYRDELHDPLIAALRRFHGNTPQKMDRLSLTLSPSSSLSRPTTTLLGVTMTDTKPIFFQKLLQAGFAYEKLADHLLRPEFRGGGSRQFGIFVIYKHCE